MAKSQLTKSIEQALTTYQPAKFGDFEINYRRGQYREFEFPVTHSHIEDGLIDYVWLAEGYCNHGSNSYCAAPSLLRYSKGMNRKWDADVCGLLQEELRALPHNTFLPCNKSCVYTRQRKVKDEAVAIICFEIKVSRADFHSPNGHNFIGNLNYYVMPYELYKQVKDEIPENIGCITYHYKREDEIGQLRHQKQSHYNHEVDHPLYNSMMLTVLNKRDKQMKKIYREMESYVNSSCRRADAVIDRLVRELRKLAQEPECYFKGFYGCSSCTSANLKCNNCYFGGIKSRLLHEEVDIRGEFLCKLP